MLKIRLFLALLIVSATHAASAFSVSFTQSQYVAAVGSQITVTINYDFSDQAVASLGADLHYDPSVLEFVSYTPNSTSLPISTAIGTLQTPGQYSQFGMITKSINGISDAAALGTFTFNILSGVTTTDTICGDHLCLTNSEFLPVVSLAAQDITDLVFAGQDGLSANVTQVPLPASVWLLLSGLALLRNRFGKK